MIRHCSHMELAASLRADGRMVDATIVDAPYSERTHDGHGTVERWSKECGGLPPPYDDSARRAISYSHWTPDDVRAFVDAWHPLTRGWIVSITDHVLGPVWLDALEATSRYVFAPLPYVAPGSRVRLTGDGPSSWTCWIIVARPATQAFARWGTLPGAYVLPPGQGGALPIVGGKPIWLMQRLVEDYSRPGDLVCDPCCGAGTTLAAALRCGLLNPAQARSVIGCDVDAAHVELARRWITTPLLASPVSERPDERQLALVAL